MPATPLARAASPGPAKGSPPAGPAGESPAGSPAYPSPRGPAPARPGFPGGKRVDLHCHSMASTEADEAVLLALRCPESFSRPEEVYAQAMRRGMDFFTLTDHDSLDGVLPLASQPDRFPGVLLGEELTCYFPEDGCKMHVLLWGLTPEHHADLQAMADDVYRCAEYVEAHRLAHAVAHPLYRQNDTLERYHLERLILIFKGFEILNGAHSPLHREALEPLLEALGPAEIGRLSAQHGLAPRWPAPWVKARTGGSDDHGLFNLGRTWTEFPASVRTPDDVLDGLREGRCAPGGEAGSSLKLAHNFYGVGVRYYGRSGAGNFRRKPQATGTALLCDLFLGSVKGRLSQHPALGQALREGLAPLGEHAEMFRLVSHVNRDLAEGIAAAAASLLREGGVGGLFDTVGAVACHQFVLLPYYFALAHQNRERPDLGRITGHGRGKGPDTMKVGVFTDTFEQINGVTRFIRDMARVAHGRGLGLTVHTCEAVPKGDAPNRKNFVPMLSRPMPGYPELTLTLPPLLEVLEWADRQQFDAIHVDTPGPMGLCGWLAAKMLRVPLLGTYHTDFPAYVKKLSGDHRLSAATASYMRWFYGRMGTVFSRSRQYHAHLRELGVGEGSAQAGPGAARLALAPACFDARTFSPARRDASLWPALGVREPRRLLYVGRVSAEKNLGLLSAAFVALCQRRRDVALVVAGDGPYRAAMAKQLAGTPAYFLGYQDDRQLGPLYASSDLFIFPSLTDTMGQVVIEAQASGLPVLVSDRGGPREVMDHDLTGRVLPASRPADAAAWVEAITALLDDEPARQRMARTAPRRMARYTLDQTFDAFWDEHFHATRRGERARDARADGKTPASLPVPAGAGRAAETSRAAEAAGALGPALVTTRG